MTTDSTHFIIVVRDRFDGRGVPLIKLELTNGVRYVTDSAGVVAFFEPSFMGREVLFRIHGPGYRFPEQHSGQPGTVLTPVGGARVDLFVQRVQAAQRLYRITGEGIYRDSLLAGMGTPIRKPDLNGGVVGQDTVIALPYRGKIYWFWGDTLGTTELNTSVAGAVSELPDPGCASLGEGEREATRTASAADRSGTLVAAKKALPHDPPAQVETASGPNFNTAGALPPSAGIDLAYFEDSRGFTKPLCPFGGPGRIWLDWAVVLADQNGRERLVAHYSRMASLNRITEQGIAFFDDEQEVFQPLRQWQASKDLRHRVDHPFLVMSDSSHYLLFASRFGFRRVPADLGSLLDRDTHETYGPLFGPARADAAGPSPQPDISRLHGWQRTTSVADIDQQQQWLSDDTLDRDQAWLRPTDLDTGCRISIYPGSIAWNPFLMRWVLIGQGGPGEVWLGCADSPVGPWVYCRKIAAHDNYSFYNPVHHPFFDEDGARTLYFEGTYSNWFSNSQAKTPRYDYNQIMYRLRLDNPELSLPVPVYRLRDPSGRPIYSTMNGADDAGLLETVEDIPFFAVPAIWPTPGLIPIYGHAAGTHFGLSDAPPPCAGSSTNRPLFLALPADYLGLEEVLTGKWRCEARGEEDRRLGFSFELSLHTGAPTVFFDEPFLTALDADVSDRRLKLRLKFLGYEYQLQADVNARCLYGRWHCLKTGETGTWEGERSDFVGVQLRSPAVAPLFEYQFGDSRIPIYSTNPDLSVGGGRRTERPLCRVWRNPIPCFLPDLGLRAVPSVGTDSWNGRK